MPKISFILELLYDVNMEMGPSCPASRKLSYTVKPENPPKPFNYICRFSSPTLQGFFVILYFHITDPPAAFWISYIGAWPEARPSEQPHLPCLAALSSPAKRSPQRVPPDHCIWQTGYWGKAFRLGLVGCKPLQSVLQERREAFPHRVRGWQASNGPNSSQGWSSCTTAARLPSGPQQGWGTGVSLLLVGERDAKVVQKGTTLCLYVTTTMSNHF